MSSGLSKRRREWDDVAALDPFWGVLTDPFAKHGGWDRSAFFASGEHVVEHLLRVAREFQLPEHRNTALDFGCGLGRLTRALSTRFANVYGVDASGVLIDQARELNGDLENCDFRHLRCSGLAEFKSGSMDLVCSFLVLQHQARDAEIAAYIAEFVRVICPGGLAVFQIPTHMPLHHRLQPRRRLYTAFRAIGVSPSILYKHLRLDPLRMRPMAPVKVQEAIDCCNGHLLAVVDDDLNDVFPSSTYYVARRSGPTPPERQ